VVAAAKLLAGLLSGPAALLAEAGHSFADSLNEGFLGVSLLRGGAPADVLHPVAAVENASCGRSWRRSRRS
jgi:divalent metal cation (Fe/Co/Zn/Cd) transporter